MFLPELSIKRPVLASMMNLALILIGLVCLFELPVREVPDIDPPIVTVTTTYTGASANVVETEVSERLEEVINGIEGIKRLTSESREELSSVTVEFYLWRDVDLAAQDVRDRVARARGQLPDDIEEPVVAKQEADASPIMWVAVYSDRYSTLEITDIAENLLRDSLQTVQGVSSVILGGSKRYAIRLRLDSDLMAARGVAVLDVERALREQNVELPSGRVENLDRELTIRTLGELKSPEEFNNLVLLRDGSTLVRLRDIGYAEKGVENERTIARYNSRPAMGLGIVKQSKANTIAVAEGIVSELEKLRPLIPEGIETFIAYDESRFVDSAITEVWRTLAIAFGFVVLTIFFFLKNVRSTFVPALTIPVSILATFAVLSLMGYSINILTMLALVLAIGLVVDDSIVVLENIYRHIENGLAPLQAAHAAMKEISFAVIATTVALVAVFLPLAYQKSITGRLFTEFAVTLCGAVIVSTFVALTLTPSFAARLLKPIKNRDAAPDFVARLAQRYLRGLTWSLDHRKTIIVFAMITIGLSAILYGRLEKEFLPDEDKGRLFTLALAPEGATPDYTDRMMQQMESIIGEVSEVAGFFSAVALPREGPGKGSEGLMFVRFAEERDRTVQDMLAGPKGLRARFFTEVEGAFALAILPKSVGRGFNQPFQLNLQSNDLDKLGEYSSMLAGRLQAEGMMNGVRSGFQFTKPQLDVEIERDRAASLGVSIQDIARTLQILFGGRDLSTVKLAGDQYDVIVQLDRKSRLLPSDLERVYVRNDRNELVQLNNVVKYRETAGPNAIFHYNRVRSAAIEGTPTGEVPLGTVIQRTEELLAETMPEGFRYEWGGEASDLKEAGQDTLFVLLLALVTIYMVLAAQFESLIHPFTVMLAVPLAAVGAFGSLWLLSGVNDIGAGMYGWANYAPDPPAIAGVLSAIVPRVPAMTINIFSQIGMVLLLGLVTKNSILLVEFANQQMEKGLSARDAMKEAALIRFRPILMTAVGTITGILPIAIGFGAGAESRRPMGVAAVGGMLSATILTFFVIPVAYTIFDDLRRSRRGRGTVNTLLSLLMCGTVTLFPAMIQAETDSDPLQNLDLKKSLELAVENNSQIAIAKKLIQKQHDVVIEARSGLLPSLDLEGQFEFTDDKLIESFGSQEFGTQKNWDVSLEATQAVFSGGKSGAGLKQQRLLEQAATLELREVALDVLLQVFERFYDVLLAEAQLKVREESVKLLEQELSQERAKFQSGTVSQFNVLRAEVEVANARSPLIRARNEINLAREELRRIIGIRRTRIDPNAAEMQVSGKLDYRPVDLTIEDALSAANKARPRVQRLDLLVEAAERGIRVEVASYYPSIDLYASYNVEKSRFSEDLDETLDGWRGGLRAKWNLFGGFETKSRVDQARASMQISEAELRQARLDVEVETRRAFSSLREAEALVRASEKVVEQGTESLRLARNRFSAGAGTQLDVLDAQVALTEAGSNRVQALYDYNVALARLRRAMGAAPRNY